MEKKTVVLETHPDGPMLTCPGPSGYTVSWGPGATHIPLSKTPPGHLAFALYCFRIFPNKHKIILGILSKNLSNLAQLGKKNLT